jgi:hypothetical protein
LQQHSNNYNSMCLFVFCLFVCIFFFRSRQYNVKTGNTSQRLKGRTLCLCCMKYGRY